MNSYFRLFTSSCLGALAAIFCIILLGALIIGIASLQGSDFPKNAVLEVDFGSVPELSDNVQRNPYSMDQSSGLGLDKIEKLIRTAKKDEKIKGIVLNGSSKAVGFATLESIREAIKEFKSSGKFIYAYDDFYSESAYYLASLADSIFLSPVGSVDLNGIGSSLIYYKELMDELGVNMEIFYAGDFKSATEPYREVKMSDYNRIQTRQFLNDLQDVITKGIAESRNLSLDQVNEYMNQIEHRTAEDTKSYGLVDDLLYLDEYHSLLRDKLRLTNSASIPTVSLEEYNSVAKINKRKSSDNRIAIVHMEGTIQGNGKDNGIISDEKYHRSLELIRKDKKFKAVVLRINSPGGDAVASENIWRDIELLKDSGKKVVASYGDYAASGGYYISCGADTIVSMPNTLTGSIGVFSMFPNVEGLMENKLKLRADSVKTHRYSLGLSPFFTLTEDEKNALQKDTDRIYDLFLNRVSEGRNMNLDRVKEIARGRVWSGEDALEIGLVDVLGDLEDAVDLAAEMAGIEDSFETRIYPSIELDFVQELMKSIQSQTKMELPKLSQEEILLLREYFDLRQCVTQKGPQMRLPMEFRFN